MGKVQILFITNLDLTTLNGASVHTNGFINGMRANDSIVKVSSSKHELLHHTSKIRRLFSNVKSIFSFFIILIFNENRNYYYRYFTGLGLQCFFSSLFNKYNVTEFNSVIEEETIDKYPLFLYILNKFLFNITCHFSNEIIVQTPKQREYFYRRFKHYRRRIYHISNASNIRDVQVKNEFSYRIVSMLSYQKWYNLEEHVSIKRKLAPYGIQLDILVSDATKEIKEKYFREIEFDAVFNGKKYDWGLFILEAAASSDKFKYGCSPIKVFEYLSYGIPVIIPDIENVNFIVRKYNTGIILRNLNSDYIVSAIRACYGDEEKWKTMSYNAISTIKSEYNWDAKMKELLKLSGMR